MTMPLDVLRHIRTLVANGGTTVKQNLARQSMYVCLSMTFLYHL
jgi:hypothetical protein